MHAPVAHLFDLHEDGDDLANFAAKVVLEHVICKRVKDHHQSAQVPLLRVFVEAFCRH